LASGSACAAADRAAEAADACREASSSFWRDAATSRSSAPVRGYVLAVASVDEYVSALTPAQREQFERVRRIVRSVVPDAEETISYGIPTFKHRGKYLIYFAAFKDHMSVYPTVGAVEATKGTKGTFRFSENDPVPEEVVRAIVTHRLQMIDIR
jgi:uncharacterized protein YdhG (YjbR/CyaY superfamily)